MGAAAICDLLFWIFALAVIVGTVNRILSR